MSMRCADCANCNHQLTFEDISCATTTLFQWSDTSFALRSVEVPIRTVLLLRECFSQSIFELLHLKLVRKGNSSTAFLPIESSAEESLLGQRTNNRTSLREKLTKVLFHIASCTLPEIYNSSTSTCSMNLLRHVSKQHDRAIFKSAAAVSCTR